MAPRGRLITIEGIDGTGKTTLAGALTEALAERGVAAELLREPGGVALSERIRALVKDPGLPISGRAEALLYAAARAQLVEEAILPRLTAGRWLVLDRFVDSSLAYQGGGRGLGVEAVRQLNRFATGDLEPDRTLLLTLSPQAARGRAGQRNEPVDRLELEDDKFFSTINGTYAELAAGEPDRIVALDASAPPAEVLAQALAAISDLI